MRWLMYLKFKPIDQPNSQVFVVIKQLYTNPVYYVLMERWRKKRRFK